jgi:hypothetical protein
VPQRDISSDCENKFSILNNKRARVKDVSRKLHQVKQECTMRLAQIEYETGRLKESKMVIYNQLIKVPDSPSSQRILI